MLREIERDLRIALEGLYEASRVEEGSMLVAGCSTSEVIGERIGTAGSADVAGVIYGVLADFCVKRGIFLAAQCCEHLNRSLVVEREALRRFGLTRVNAVPQLHAGGAFATAAWASMKEPLLVETVSADLGIDIGGTLIGMHLRPVAVPVRLEILTIGEARLTLARSRCKFVGGERAVYDPSLK